MIILYLAIVIFWYASVTLVIGLMKKMKPMLVCVFESDASEEAVQRTFQVYAECIKNVSVVQLCIAVCAVLSCIIITSILTKTLVLMVCIGIAITPMIALVIAFFKSFSKTFGFDALTNAKIPPVLYGLMFGVGYIVTLVIFLYTLCVAFAIM